MIDDIPAVREQLSEHWQKIAVDLVKQGFRPEAAFETMLTVALAGYVELHGKDGAAERLVSLAHRLSEQAQSQAQAIKEAARATKN